MLSRAKTEDVNRPQKNLSYIHICSLFEYDNVRSTPLSLIVSTRLTSYRSRVLWIRAGLIYANVCMLVEVTADRVFFW